MKKAFLLFVTSMFLLHSCSNDDNGGGTTPDPDPDGTPEPTISVQLVSNTTHGQILTDGDGNSLYFFSKDQDGQSACGEAGDCINIWPLFYEENLTLGEGLSASDFGEITREDGDKQTTYKGWPLYYFMNDNAPGDTNGDDVNNIWYVAKPDYSLMYAREQLVGHDDKNYLSDYTEGDGETSYIVDINGRTLYTFANDTKDQNNFTAADFSNNGVWPIAEITLDKIPSILDNADFGTINVYGRTQLTYRGWPLYYFGQDATRGDNKGVSFPAPGVWPIANVDTAAAPVAEAEPTVKLADNNTHGKILTDTEGNSLYFFSKDQDGQSACGEAGGCIDIWPVFYVEDLILDEGLSASDFSEITREDGAKQTTYKGWPLYYYMSDDAPGDTNGDDVNHIWYVAKPDYSLMYAREQLVGHDGKNYTSDYTEGDGETSYIVDINGRTLYTFANDVSGQNTFTLEDFSNNSVWPIAEITLDQIPSILNSEDFGTIDVYGRTQLTYKGWPLYYFGQDAVRGDNKGVSFPAPGVWPIANVDTPMVPGN